MALAGLLVMLVAVLLGWAFDQVIYFSILGIPSALLAALVVSASVSSGSQLVADARLIGVGAAGVLLALRAPILVVVIVAAAAAALARLWLS